jgi:LysR family glycine cleavage system transcriptional activator
MWHKIPPLRCLKAFDAVARHQSITRAASEENVSQSAISQSISQLERLVGTRLLDRALRPATLTEQGKAFHLTITDTIGRLSSEVDKLQASSRGDKKSITISCNLGFATYWLMPRLGEFSQQYPEVTLNVMTTYQGAADFQPGVDIAIRFGNGGWPEGDGTLLFKEQLVPTCSSGYLARHGAIDSPEELIEHNLINVQTTDPSWLGWQYYFNHFDVLNADRANGSWFSNYVQAVQATVAGEGVMLGWQSVIGDLVSTHQLVAAVDASIELSSGYHALVSRQAKTKMILGDFVEWLQNIACREG